MARPPRGMEFTWRSLSRLPRSEDLGSYQTVEMLVEKSRYRAGFHEQAQFHVAIQCVTSQVGAITNAVARPRLPFSHEDLRVVDRRAGAMLAAR